MFKFYSAMASAAFDVNKSRLCLLSLPNGACWADDTTMGSHIFVREELMLLLSLILDIWRKDGGNVLITG